MFSVIVCYGLFNKIFTKTFKVNNFELTEMGGNHTNGHIKGITQDSLFGGERKEQINQVWNERKNSLRPEGQHLPSDTQNEEFERNDYPGEQIYLPIGMILDDIPVEYKDNLDRFIDRLDEIMNNNVDEHENEEADSIFFSTIMPDLSSGLHYIPESFSTYSLCIFATFESTTENMNDQSKVLVKWHNSNGELVFFEYLSIIPNSNFNYVWTEMDYWNTGIYNVEIYELENNIRLLASGSFLVENLSEYVSYLRLYPSSEQWLSESVFYNNDEINLIFNHSSFRDRYLNLSVYKVESRESMINENIFLPASYQEKFKYVVKHTNNIFPYGTYIVELSSAENYLIGRSRFYIYQ